jgi:predicted DNA-binding transcriptional regulator YafY
LSNMHRIQWFDQWIRESRYPSSQALAEQFEISRRQAQRDIEYMEHTLRAPLLYVAKHRGYIYEDRAYLLPSLYMTEEEKSVLRFLANRYNQYDHDNADQVRRVAHLLDRFVGGQEIELDSRLPSFQADPRLMDTVLRLSNAIQAARVTEFRYDGEHLIVWPLRLFAHYNTDYLEACCETSGRQRTFRLNQIASVNVTVRRFNPAEAERGLPDETAPAVRKPFTARVRLTEALPVGGTWNGFVAKSPSDDKLIYDVDFYDTNAFLQHLTTGRWEILLGPKWLRVKLREMCADVLNRIEREK